MRSLHDLSKSPIMQTGQQWRGKGKAAICLLDVRRFLRRSQSEQGQSLVEFAFASVMFFVLVFAVFDFAHLFFVEMSVQNAIQEAARYGSTGNHLPDPNKQGNTLSRVTSIIDTLQNDALGVTVSNIQVSSAGGGSGSAGGPGDLLTVSTTVNMPLMTPVIAQMFPNGQFTFSASITVKNEPFPPNLTN